jgi:HK97 family phage major capsid protein
MTTLREQALEERRKDVLPRLREARQLAEKAESENRALTDAEQKVYDDAVRDAKSLSDAFEKQRHDTAVFAFAKELGESVGDTGAARTKGQRLSFKGLGASVASKMLGSDGLGAKALAPSGAAVVAQGFTSDPIALGRIATGLLDVLPVKVQPTAEYAFMRQTTRTNNAAVVADGAVKPTSPLGVTRVEQSLAVIAHLSEGVPRFWLLDNTALEQFIDNELRYGLGVALEAKVLADINATSGIQLQAYATSVLATVRKGITKLEVAGYSPSAIVLHPSDFEGIELALASTSAIEHLSLPFDAATRRLFGVPIASTVSEAAGVAHVLATDAVVVDTSSEGIGVQWSQESNSDDFSRNLIRCRAELRANTSVLSPAGVVSCDLTA